MSLRGCFSGVRAEVPWVNRSPAEIIRDNIRLTVQPFDTPPGDADAVARIIEQIDDDRMLLFASDYPHWQFEGDAILPPGLSGGALKRFVERSGGLLVAAAEHASWPQSETDLLPAKLGPPVDRLTGRGAPWRPVGAVAIDAPARI